MIGSLRETSRAVTAGQMDLLPIPALQDNYIWLLRDAGGRALVVDPGDAGPVLAALDDGPPPHAILLTHHHHDHIGGVPALLARWPGTPVIAPRDERIARASVRVDDGERIKIGAWRFDVIAVPGHTRSHLAYHGEGLLFCGDTLFSLGCGRMFEGTPAQMHASLQRLAALPDATWVCCAHEYTQANAAFAHAVDPDNPSLQARVREVLALHQAQVPTLPTRLVDERACNPFLRCFAPSVRAAAQHQTRQPLLDDSMVFGALRAWKDGFRA